MTAIHETSPLALRFGGRATDGSGAVDVPVPLIAGPELELLLPVEGQASMRGSYRIQESGEALAGIASCGLAPGLDVVSHRLYRELFELLREMGHQVHRLWHYVPNINDSPAGLENYRVFNVGRRRAFDEYFGPRAESLMPAASAVGSAGQELVIAFVGGKTPPRFIENPRQTPAYRYPEDYGPKTPSFARAAVVGDQVYISGTASICGHETRHAGDLMGQWNVTLENLEALAAEVGAGNWERVRQFPGYRLKVYLRHAGDFERLWPLMQSALGATEENAVVLQAAICRAELDLEIEASFQL
jgi:enamine deaminase RidA (YjgF/YER057c/UK114 family)